MSSATPTVSLYSLGDVVLTLTELHKSLNGTFRQTFATGPFTCRTQAKR